MRPYSAKEKAPAQSAGARLSDSLMTGAIREIGDARAILALGTNTTVDHPIFGLEVPVEVPGVDSKLLDPRATWRDLAAYDEKATYLATRFKENFQKFGADENIVRAGPLV